LVLSVVPSIAEPNSYVLRLDFFDRAEKVSVPFAVVHRAPKTQWEKKGERRFVVPANASVTDLRRVIREIVAVGR
jgi:hypothetical protein